MKHKPAKRTGRYRVNMLDADNFAVALLGEFGYYQYTIAKALGLSLNQVQLRLRYAKVDPRAYRRGEALIGQMILRGVAQAGVPQLRHFAEVTLTEQLKKLGWSGAGIQPEPSPSLSPSPPL